MKRQRPKERPPRIGMDAGTGGTPGWWPGYAPVGPMAEKGYAAILEAHRSRKGKVMKLLKEEEDPEWRWKRFLPGGGDDGGAGEKKAEAARRKAALEEVMVGQRPPDPMFIGRTMSDMLYNRNRYHPERHGFRKNMATREEVPYDETTGEMDLAGRLIGGIAWNHVSAFNPGNGLHYDAQGRVVTGRRAARMEKDWRATRQDAKGGGAGYLAFSEGDNEALRRSHLALVEARRKRNASMDRWMSDSAAELRGLTAKAKAQYDLIPGGMDPGARAAFESLDALNETQKTLTEKAFPKWTKTLYDAGVQRVEDDYNVRKKHNADVRALSEEAGKWWAGLLSSPEARRRAEFNLEHPGLREANLMLGRSGTNQDAKGGQTAAGIEIARARRLQGERELAAWLGGSVRSDAKGGRSVRADEGGGVADDEWIRRQTDGSYVTRSGGAGTYQWYNKDGSFRGEAKDYQEIGRGGRVFFGDLSTGAGRVTVGGDERNATDVTGFKMSTGDDGSTTFNYSTGRSQRSFSYNADGTMKTAGNRATATYQNGDKATIGSTYDPTEHRDAKGNVVSVAGMVHEKTEGGGEYVNLSPEMQKTKDALASARAEGIVTKTDLQRQDYLDNLAPGVAEKLDEKTFVTAAQERVEGQLQGAVGSYQKTGEGAYLDKAKQLAATQEGLKAMSSANQSVANLEIDPLSRKQLAGVGKSVRVYVFNRPGAAASLVAGRSDLWGPGAGEARGVGGPGTYYFGNPAAVSSAVGKPWRKANTLAKAPAWKPKWMDLQADDKGGRTRR